MSYDLVVFRKKADPKAMTDFMKWYQDHTKWTERHSYDNPANTSIELRNWFMKMIQTFLAMIESIASDDDDNSNLSGNCVYKDVIYVAFAWSVVEQTHTTMLELVEKHTVVFLTLGAALAIVCYLTMENKTQLTFLLVLFHLKKTI